MITFSSCQIRWKTNPNNILLTNYKIKSSYKKIKKGKVKESLYPVKNKEIFGLKFYLWMYQIGDQGDVEEGIRRKQEKVNQKNQQKLEKYELKKARYYQKKELKNKRRDQKKKYPKDIKPYKRFKPKVYKPTTKQWFTEVVGEAPVFMDSVKVKDVKEQVEIYLDKKGFFDAKVSYALKYKKKKPKVKVLIYIDANEPYKFRNVDYEISDPVVDQYIGYFKSNLSIEKGTQYDEFKLSDERKKIVGYLQKHGYFNFRKNMVTYDVDTTVGSRELDVTIKIGKDYEQINDSIVFYDHHTRYQIGEVNVYVDTEKSKAPTTTISELGYNFIFAGKRKYNTKFLRQNILLFKGEMFSNENVKQTYKRLSSLSVFKFIEIEFRKVDSTTLETNINLITSNKYNYSIETNGTVRGSDLGINATVTFNTKNLFKGAEILRLKLSGGIEASRVITSDPNDPNTRGFNLVPNTVEVGPEVSLIFPKFLLPIRQDRIKKSLVPKTSFNFVFNYQDRPDFVRFMNRFSFAYEWRKKLVWRQIMKPIDLSVISIDRSADFDEYLNTIDDPILKSSYQDHFIQAVIYEVFYNNQNRKVSNNRLFNFLHLQSAGNILRLLSPALGLEQDSLGGYQVSGITFAQYLKFQNDFRYTHVVNEKNSFAFRAIAGLAYPLANLKAIPFERAFFTGGANDVRAWQARTLGPGSYFDPYRNYDKIGDVKIEFNAEYRFNLIDFLDGAVFVDVGNIWLVEENPARPGGNFELSRFYNELAVGTGFGLRLNFNLFIIRFDLGIQTYDPSLVPGERWVWQPKDQFNQTIDDINATGVGQPLDNYRTRLNLNLGIGYPF